MFGLDTLKILLGALPIGESALQGFLGSLTLLMRVLKILVGRLPIRLRTFAIRVCSFEIGLGALKVSLRAFTFCVRTFEIRLHSCPLGRDRLLEFTLGVRCRLVRHVLGFGSCPYDRFRQRALYLRAGRSDLGLQAGTPLRMDLVELRGPSLFGLELSPLTSFLERRLMRLREVAQVSVELGLKLRPDSINDALNLFLGH